VARRPWHGDAQGGGGAQLAWVKEEEETGVGHVGRTGRRWLGRLGQNLKENSFRNKNWIFEYTKALKICTRRFSRNFDMGIFPKFF
jgi:hypothetical protein